MREINEHEMRSSMKTSDMVKEVQAMKLQSQALEE
jgi:hypothetical protein